MGISYCNFFLKKTQFNLITNFFNQIFNFIEPLSINIFAMNSTLKQNNR